MPSTSIIDELRQRIKDTRYNFRAFTLAVSDPNVTTAIAEITNDHLIVTTGGGSATSIDFDLTTPRYDTIGKLYEIVSRITGYAAQLDNDADLDHPSIDLFNFGPIDVRTNGMELRHRLFSDAELEMVLSQAIQRHNASFSISTLPAQENVFVFELAQASVLRIQAADASKRRGMDATVSDLLQLASSFESAYASDVARNAKAIVSVKEASPSTMGEGDVVMGKLYRRSGRTGFMSPISQVPNPTSPKLIEPDPMVDAEDDKVLVKWVRNKDEDFYSYELWMDTRPEVTRSREGFSMSRESGGFGTAPNNYWGSGSRTTTSKLVFRSFGPNSNISSGTYSTFVEEFGQGVSAYAAGPLESESDYYFRLYAININDLAVASNVVHFTTKQLRVRFLQTGYMSATSGGAGATVTLHFDPTKGYLVQSLLNNPNGGFVFRLGGKVVNLTYIDNYTASFVVPQFQILGLKDLSIESPNGLVDIKSYQFNVTS